MLVYVDTTLRFFCLFLSEFDMSGSYLSKILKFSGCIPLHIILYIYILFFCTNIKT